MISEWATVEIDQVIRDGRANGIQHHKIATEIMKLHRVFVTPNMVIRRARTIRASVPEGQTKYHKIIDMSLVDGSIPPWRSDAADEILARDVALGCTLYQMSLRHGVSEDSIRRRRGILGLSKPLPESPREAPVYTLPPLPSAALDSAAPSRATPMSPRYIAPHPTALQFRVPVPRPLPEPRTKAYIPPSRRCAYPMWDDHERSTFRFCDAPVDVRSYCMKHARDCYITVRDRREDVG